MKNYFRIRRNVEFEKRIIVIDFNYSGIAELVGSINLGKFQSFSKGKILFTRFSYDKTKNGCFELTYRFSEIKKTERVAYKYRSFKKLGIPE